MLPPAFWLAVLAWLYFLYKAWTLREESIGIPMLTVLATVGAWYGGDPFYNDYGEYIQDIGKPALENAWWEVLLFIVAFGTITPAVHRTINRKFLRPRSNLLYLVRHGVDGVDNFQTQIDWLCRVLAFVWALIMITALVRTNFDFVGLFMPYLGAKAEPWIRGRIGTGFDSLISLAAYILVGLTAEFGVFTALSTRNTTRLLALTVYLLALPTYIFDRTRNTMLATILPGFCAWVFLRVRGGLIIRIIFIIAGFMVLEAWLKFVIANRTDQSIATAFQQELKGQSVDTKDVKHLGFNMFEELGHINAYITDGSYRPNWGARYFAELVNPIPRALWPGKPLIGLDYAVARGLAYDDAGANQGGVAASVSTGMVGQGVVNFGRFLGPVAAASLMALWASLLARQDLQAARLGRLFLYALGLFLTFNMGRDITLLVIYPYCFFYVFILGVEWIYQARTAARIKTAAASGDDTEKSAKSTRYKRSPSTRIRRLQRHSSTSTGLNPRA